MSFRKSHQIALQTRQKADGFGTVTGRVMRNAPYSAVLGVRRELRGSAGRTTTTERCITNDAG